MTAASRRTLARCRRTTAAFRPRRTLRSHGPWLRTRAPAGTPRRALVERATPPRIVGLWAKAPRLFLTLHGSARTDSRRRSALPRWLGGAEMLDLGACAQLLAAIRTLLPQIRLGRLATRRPGVMRSRRPRGIADIGPRPGIVDVAALHRRGRTDPLRTCRSRRPIGRYRAARKARACRRRIRTANRRTHASSRPRARNWTRTRCRSRRWSRPWRVATPLTRSRTDPGARTAREIERLRIEA